MNKLYWLASYPKSGSTWFRVFLTNYLDDGEKPADINHLKAGLFAGDRQVFDRWAGVEASDLSAEEIANLRPEVYRQLALHSDHRLYIKAHDACTRNAEGQLLFPPDVTGGVLYIIRNPLDVAVSYAHHGGHSLQPIAEALCDSDGRAREIPASLPLHLPLRLLSWRDHVLSWVDERELRVTVIRYEDMLSRAEATFSAGLSALDLVPDAVRLATALDRSRFEILRAQEQEIGFAERQLQADAPFFRRGGAGSWRAELPAALASRIVASQGDVMRRFEYLDARGRPVY